MMRFIFMMVLSISLTGCQSSDDNNDGTYGLIKPIKLSKPMALVDQGTTTDMIRIMDGNDNYRIIFPKQIFIDGNYVSYSENALKLFIDSENNIVVERTLLNAQMISGLFLIADKEGEKKLFVVDMLHIAGNLYDFEDLEKKYLNKTDYWQY